MNRRRFLALTGLGITGTAGCTTGKEQTTTNSPTTTSPEYNLDIGFSGLQSGVVEFLDGAYELIYTPGTQYLFLDVTVASERPPAGDLVFRFDGEAFTPKTEWDWPPLHRGEDSSGEYPDTTGEDRYGSVDGRDGWVVFELPEQGDASQAVLTWPGGEWTPAETVRSRLANPLPDFTLEKWNAPETISDDTKLEFEIAVRNDGTQPGQFWGAIDKDEFTTDRVVTLVTRRIPPGETESWRVSGGNFNLPPEELIDEDERINYTLLWEGENRSDSTRIIYE